MAIKLEIKNLYKIFGEHPQRAFKYIEKGLSKEQILEKTGLSLGVKDANLTIEEGEIFVIMGLSGSGMEMQPALSKFYLVYVCLFLKN